MLQKLFQKYEIEELLLSKLNRSLRNFESFKVRDLYEIKRLVDDMILYQDKVIIHAV